MRKKEVKEMHPYSLRIIRQPTYNRCAKTQLLPASSHSTYCWRYLIAYKHGNSCMCFLNDSDLELLHFMNCFISDWTCNLISLYISSIHVSSRKEAEWVFATIVCSSNLPGITFHTIGTTITDKSKSIYQVVQCIIQNVQYDQCCTLHLSV